MGTKFQNPAQAADFLHCTVQRLGQPPEGRGSKSILASEGYYFGRRDGQYVLEHEYYVPESYGSDDDSYLGMIPHRDGYDRVMVSATAPTVEALIAAVES